MTYITSALLFIVLLSIDIQTGYARSAGKPDSNTNLRSHKIKNSAPFIFINGRTLVGKIGYRFDNIQQRRHTSYVVEYNGVGIELGGGYRIKNIGLFASLGLNVLNYWSGEQIRTNRNKDSTKTYSEGVITEHGYPNKQRSVSLGLEYSIQLSPHVQVVPFVMAKTWKYKNNRFLPKTKYEDNYYQLEENYSYGGGILLRGRLPDKSAIGLSICILRSQFNPAGYFESLNAVNLDTSNKIIAFSLSYEFNFSGYKIGLLNHEFSFF